MSQLINFLFVHRLEVFWVIALCVTSMPTPDAKDGKFYVWFFSVAHAICANVARARVGVKNGNGG